MSLVDYEPSADQIDLEVTDTIDCCLPDERDEDNVSVSLDPFDVTWMESDRLPIHVGIRIHEAELALATCPDLLDAEDLVEGLNQKPLKVFGRVFAPEDGLEGLLAELADNFRHYIDTTHPLKLWWHLLIRKRPWLAGGI